MTIALTECGCSKLEIKLKLENADRNAGSHFSQKTIQLQPGFSERDLIDALKKIERMPQRVKDEFKVEAEEKYRKSIEGN